MAPGPRKKGSHKRGTGDSIQDNRNDRRSSETENAQISKNETPSDTNNGEEKKYSKRSIKSNWNRYEELPNDPLADKMRGNDFEVLSSYSGGTGSQLQLQDEKDWDDAAIDDKNITLDLKNLIQAMKCIPFHEKIHLSKNVFDEKQISNFFSNAEYWQKSYIQNSESPIENVPESLESQLNIIENLETISNTEEISIKPQTIENKTENIIESLTSNLSLKSQTKEKNQTVNVTTIKDDSKENKLLSSISFLKPQAKENERVVKSTAIEDASKVDDELDFLLSLNISLNEPMPAVNEPKSVASNVTNVDDWLNSLLD